MQPAEWGKLSIQLGKLVDRCKILPQFRTKVDDGQAVPSIWSKGFRVSVVLFTEDTLSAVALAFPLAEAAVQLLSDPQKRERLPPLDVLGEHAAVAVPLDPAWDRCQVLTVAWWREGPHPAVLAASLDPKRGQSSRAGLLPGHDGAFRLRAVPSLRLGEPVGCRAEGTAASRGLRRPA